MRRIVPDNSVIVAAFYPEVLERNGQRINITERARPVLTAISEYRVMAYAPHALMGEFLKVSRDKSSVRQGAAHIDPAEADESVRDFLTLPITYIPETELAESAWRLTREHGLSPTDAWFLACAMKIRADLWLTHRQKDGFAQAAQALYGQVYLLTENTFHV